MKRDLAYFTDVLGGRIRFAVEGIGARIAVYELTRPGAAASFEGRRDF